MVLRMRCLFTWYNGRNIGSLYGVRGALGIERIRVIQFYFSEYFKVPLLDCGIVSRFWNPKESKKAPPPMPLTEDLVEVIIDNDIIRRLDLTPFDCAIGISSSSGKHETQINKPHSLINI
ncbi:hypothetical protein RJ641_027579 [Dillenia turbinata]|uniref:Uncharacterized protein n=1 Tax=Dillenia turbinata TaxID=194707 RepID=A0AAN8W5W4_9MAGN